MGHSKPAGRCWIRLLLPAAALVVSLALFGVFVSLAGVNPLDVYAEMYRGAFGTWFSFKNTLQRAAPLMLTGLCTALPARLGLIVIGGEGALVVGGLAAAAAALALPAAPPDVVIVAMMLAAIAAGGVWIGAVGMLRSLRGVNETISSLLLAYIAIALLNHLVEGPLKDPASLNKPSTAHIGEANMLGLLPGLDVHLGLLFGLVACIGCQLLMEHTTFGFSARIVGGNSTCRAAERDRRALARGDNVFHRGRRSGSRGHGGGRRRARQGQCLARGRLRLRRHSGGVSGQSPPAVDRAGCDVCSAESTPAAACCSVRSHCRTPR